MKGFKPESSNPLLQLNWRRTKFINQCPSRNEDFCSISRHAKKITAAICLIFRGLFFEHNAEIGQKDHFWMDTNQKG
jgi:hypothetical protein